MKRLAAAYLLLSLSACTMNGYRDETGKINLGPNATGDDQIHHAPYPSYAEYALATHELDGIGDSADQKLCLMRAILDHVPSTLQSRLNDYAIGKTILMESQFSDLDRELRGYVDDETFMQSIKPQLSMCLT